MENNNVGKVLHVGISVYNMDESLDWYKKNLGFELVDDFYAPPLGARICFVEKEDFQLEFFQYDAPKKLPEERFKPNSDIQTVGTKHMAIETDDMDSLKKRFLENGVDIAHEVAMKGDKVMFVRDNSGIIIEFIHRNGDLK